MSEWQPIETAPKDGSTILAAARIKMPWGKPIRMIWWKDRCWHDATAGRYHNNENLIAWMPLPDPPKQP